MEGMVHTSGPEPVAAAHSPDAWTGGAAPVGGALSMAFLSGGSVACVGVTFLRKSSRRGGGMPDGISVSSLAMVGACEVSS